MKKVFIDTNIIVDLLAKREPFYEEAAMLFTLADKQQVNLSVSALTFANTNYILSQSLKPEEVRQILRKLKLIVQVLCINEKIIGLSLNDNDFRDFEDAVQYYTALENDTNIIITRNLKNFQKAKLPVMTAAQFLTTI